jgi:ankyrin repeat protein
MTEVNIKQLNAQLCEAAKEGDNSAVRKLLTQGAELNHISPKYGASPLYIASHFNKVTTVRLLTAKGADLESAIEDGSTPIYTSAFNCFSDITKILLGKGADIEKEVKSEDILVTPLRAAASQGCVKDYKLLSDAGASLHLEKGYTSDIISSAKNHANDSPEHKEIENLVMRDYFKWLKTALSDIKKNLKYDPSKSFEVVVVRYDEDDLSWIEEEFTDGERIIIYNKGADDLGDLPSNYKVVNIPNVGWFGGTILYHLANSYETLADRTIFLQADPYEGHAVRPFVQYKENFTSKCKNIVANCVETTLLSQAVSFAKPLQRDWDKTKYANRFKVSKTTMIDDAHEFIDENLNPEAPLAMVWGAQLAIDKEKVYLNPQEYYQNALSFFNEQYAMKDFPMEKLWDEMLKPNKIGKPVHEIPDANNDKIKELIKINQELDNLLKNNEDYSKIMPLSDRKNKLVNELESYIETLSNRNDNSLIIPSESEEKFVNELESKVEGLSDREDELVNPFESENKEKLNGELANAAWNGDNVQVKNFLVKGANIDSKHTDLEATSLSVAVKNNQITTVELLLKEGADKEIPMTNGGTPLHVAAVNNRHEIVRLLLDAGADRNIKVDALTPLGTAAYFGQLASVKVFMDMGVSILSDDLRSAFYTAAKMRDDSPQNKEVYEYMKSHYDEIVESYPQIESPEDLVVVVVRYDEDLSWIYKEFKNSKNVKVIVYNKGEDDLDYLPDEYQVVKTPNVGWLGGTYLKYIIDNYENLNGKILLIQGYPYDTEAFYPLIRYTDSLKSSCSNIIGKCEKTTVLKHSNIFSSYTDEDWKSGQYKCFVEPINYTMTEYVHKFFDPDYNPEDDLDMDLGAVFAIHASQLQSRPKSFYEKLLPHFNSTKCPRGDFFLEKLWNLVDITLWNAELANAAWNGDDAKVEQFLARGANINSLHTDLKATPLYLATRGDHPSTVELLLRKGADKEIPITTGETPLYTASFNCFSESAKKLLDAEANKEITVDRKTPVFISIKNGCLQNVDDLLNSGAKLYSDDSLTHYEVHTPININSYIYNDENQITNYNIEKMYNVVLNHYWKTSASEIAEICEKTKDDSKTFEVVIVRYKEDLSWVAKEFPCVKVTIYNKGPDDLGKFPDNITVKETENVGYLGGTYLKHIVDNYENLADRVLFAQGHIYDVDTYLPALKYLILSETNCKNIIAKCIQSTLGEEWNFLRDFSWDNNPRYKDFIPRDANMMDFTHKHIGNLSSDHSLPFSVGAIYAVEKAKIYNHPVESYAAMLPEFNTTKPMQDHYAERLPNERFEARYDSEFYKEQCMNPEFIAKYNGSFCYDYQE